MVSAPFERKVIDWLAPQPVKTGDFGVELEVEGYRLPLDVAGWVTKPENSLRGECIEYVTRGACSLNVLTTRLKNLNKTFEACETKINLTDRASTHIHINMQNYTFRDVIGFIMLFSALEQVIIRSCGPNRDGNLFCLSSLDTGDLPMFMGNFANVICLQHAKYYRQRGKYAALNIDPIISFGTLEVRCFPNTVDQEKILTWAKWIRNIREFAKNWNTDAYEGFVDTLYFDAENITEMILPGLHPWTMLAPYSVKDLVHKGVETSYEIYKEVKEHLNKSIVLKKPPKVVDWSSDYTSVSGPFQTVELQPQPPELQFTPDPDDMGDGPDDDLPLPTDDEG